MPKQEHDWFFIFGMIVVVILLVLASWKLAHGADLSASTIIAKSGDVITSSSKFPTTAVKIDTKEIVVGKLIVLSAQNSGFVFVNILTEIPWTTVVFVDSLAISEGDTILIPVEREIQAFNVAGKDTTLLWKNRNIQCSWVEYKIDKDGKKVARLIDIDGSDITLPIERVLRVWK